MEVLKLKWSEFEKKHPKLAKWVYQIAFFFVFSMGVTIIQYLFFTFMPELLGDRLAGTEFMWPQIPMNILGVKFTWSLLGYDRGCFDWRRTGIFYQL